MAGLLMAKELCRQTSRTRRIAPLIGSANNLPEAYKRFWEELHAVPTPVHWKPKEGKWTKDKYGVLKPIQNVPIPVRHPAEVHEGIWGGEAVIQGYRQEGNKYTRRVAEWWVPTFRETVLYSEVLNKHLKVMVTDRTISLVHEHQGFDYYLLNTRACDLVSWLALALKRKILFNIRDDTYPHKDEDVEFVKQKYQKYLSLYDPEFIEWYGLKMEDAVKKFKAMQIVEVRPKKELYRQELLENLRSGAVPLVAIPAEEESGSLLSKSSNLLGKIKSKIL